MSELSKKAENSAKDLSLELEQTIQPYSLSGKNCILSDTGKYSILYQLLYWLQDLYLVWSEA